ncbi:hypothetical protein [Prescottella equi]|uniref:hypothetical protein n=1 Tax=Rhodococcus hoagii TaxID=43767 RepID=UPI001EEADBEF|nr:hypothetical protein [Prescottella equi]
MSTAEQIIAEALVQWSLEPCCRTCAGGLAAHVVAALTNAGKTIVSKPDPKNPTPALIEAAYIAQDDLSTTPTWAIGAAAEVIDAYIDAQHHETVHVLGHAARVAEGGER